MMRATILAAMLAILPSPAAARKAPPPTWQVMRSTDPITRVSTCAVVASDFLGRMRFTQVGALYPVIEKNSVYGLLVGVSSGGRYRIPSGDIVWAVDEHPFRELKAADNPAHPAATASHADAVTSVTAQTLQLATSLTASSTMASGAKADEMLQELLTGKTLLFRRAAPTPLIGLPNYETMMTGQINAKGELRPIPLDASLHAALLECGIVRTGEAN